MDIQTFRPKLDALIAAGDVDGVDGLVSEFLDNEDGRFRQHLDYMEEVFKALPLPGGFGTIHASPMDRAVQQLYETVSRYR
jgi:hypothetical protein